MASTKELTGGTGDVNPQQLFLDLSQSGADAATNFDVPLPIPRYNAKANRSIVLEILRIVSVANQTTAPGAGVASEVQVTLGTQPTPLVTQATTFFVDSREIDTITAIGVQGPTNRAYQFDYTDGAGHGFLVATDNLGARVNSTNTGLTNRFFVRVYYRFKEVPLAEYIGIVQGQQ